MDATRTRLSLAALALATLALALPAQAQAPTGAHTVVRIPVTHTAFNPCTEEDVTFTGTLVGQFHLRQDQAGMYQVFARVNTAGMTGTGATSGATYVGSGHASFRESFSGLPATVEADGRFVLNRRGRGGDATGTLVLGVSVDADGDIDAQLLDLDVDCRGLLVPQNE